MYPNNRGQQEREELVEPRDPQVLLDQLDPKDPLEMLAKKDPTFVKKE